MDDHRFDHLTRIFAMRAPRRLVAGAIVGGTLGSLVGGEAVGKNKRKKKRMTRSQQPCRSLQEACGFASQARCCRPLVCNDNTCRQCTLLQNPCEDHDDCCLATAACGSTIFATGVCCQQLGNACGLDSDCCANTGKCGLDGCGGGVPVCCRGQGSQCGSSCECCDPLRCLSGTCQ